MPKGIAQPCECVQLCYRMSEQIPRHGVFPTECIVRTAVLLEDLWAKILSCGQCDYDRLAIPLISISNGSLAMSWAVALRYELLDRSNPDHFLATLTPDVVHDGGGGNGHNNNSNVADPPTAIKSTVCLENMDLDDEEAGLLVRQLLRTQLTQLSALLRKMTVKISPFLSGDVDLSPAKLPQPPKPTLSHVKAQILMLLDALGCT